MSNVLKEAAEFLGKVLNKIASVNLWPYVITLIVLMFVISFVVQTLHMKKVARKFSEGAIDDKTVKICQKFRRRSIFPQAAEMHDLFCCMLCSMHMERNEEDLFFANINDIKKTTEHITRRLYLLLVAYLTKQRYLDWAKMYHAQKDGEQSAADWLKTQQLPYNETQLRKAAEKITNPKVCEILKVLTEE